MPWEEDGDNIDLFPEGFVWERGCTTECGDKHVLRTPTGRTVIISVGGKGALPYILKNDLNLILNDLPEAQTVGRSGQPAEAPTVARASRTDSLLRSQLHHLKDDFNKPQLQNVRSKYRNLPDLYYKDDPDKVITPERFEKWSTDLEQGRESSRGLPRLWELCSGSTALSARARQKGVSHLPPVDFRYGWNTGRIEDQILIMDVLLSSGVQTLFASPNCAPWGNHTRSLPRDILAAKRQLEEPSLQFLAAGCLAQVLQGRRYLVENSAHSDIFT